MTSERDAYTVLQVLPEAPPEVIQAAYRALARQYHPDGLSPHVERMKEINNAYDRVRTAERRAKYDSERRSRLVPVGPGRPSPAAHASAHGSAHAAVHASAPAAPVRPPFGFRPVASAAQDDADVLDFGHYAGWRIAQIARHDPDYLRWLSRHSAGVRYLEAIRRSLPGERDLGRRSSVSLDW